MQVREITEKDNYDSISTIYAKTELITTITKKARENDNLFTNTHSIMSLGKANSCGV